MHNASDCYCRSAGKTQQWFALIFHQALWHQSPNGGDPPHTDTHIDTLGCACLLRACMCVIAINEADAGRLELVQGERVRWKLMCWFKLWGSDTLTTSAAIKCLEIKCHTVESRARPPQWAGNLTRGRRVNLWLLQNLFSLKLLFNFFLSYAPPVEKYCLLHLSGCLLNCCLNLRRFPCLSLSCSIHI